jgi:catechol 2,3-dioxygenase-like lactoylglutathione lyase family enzyme
MITALQHIGLGVQDAATSFEFYRKFAGFKIKLVDYLDFSNQMEPIIGDLVKMRIIMALPSQGKGLIEIVQHVSTPPRPGTTRWGDIGFLATGYRTNNLAATVEYLESEGIELSVRSYPTDLNSGERWESAFLSDPDGNYVELIDTNPGNSADAGVGGIIQVTIGVRDMDRSLEFYNGILGYDEVLLDMSGPDAAMGPFLENRMQQRQVILGRKVSLRSPFAMDGGGTIRLVQVKDYPGKNLFEGRRWGDIGQMEACFEVDDVRAAVEELKSMNMEVYHPPTYMDMGTGSKGSFAYIKDPDGTLIEFVEVHRVFWMSPKLFASLFDVLSPVVARLSR